MSAAALLALIPSLVSGIRSGANLLNQLRPQIKALFDRNEITIEQQAELLSAVDSIFRTFQGDNLPEHWKIQPDPEI